MEEDLWSKYRTTGKDVGHKQDLYVGLNKLLAWNS